MVENGWASQHRPAVVAFLRALRKGTDYMFAHPDESAELGAKELRTSPANARRALEDTVRMDVMARDLSLRDLSLQRVFTTMQDAGAMPRDAVYDRSKFVDESYLQESRR
jgi:ABC-type nitrate/sulfonate/bicarbonate transport system substrate-binding protein